MNSMVIKPAVGAIGGVTIPLASEYLLKGKRLGATEEEPTKGYKWSGIIGISEGIVGLGAAFKVIPLGITKDEDKAMAAAFGGAGLATGVGILMLDEARKRAQYEFRRKTSRRLRRTNGRILLRDGLEYERKVEPVTPLVEEI